MISLETRRKISATLKAKGIKPKQRYDITGKKHKPEWYVKMRATMDKKLQQRPVIICLNPKCKNLFQVTPARKETAKYCSKKCKDIHRGDTCGWVLSINRRIRGSTEYIAWRNGVFKRDGYTCQDCGIIGGRLEAHHILSFSNFPELRFELSNGKTLCLPCHKLTPNYGNKKKEEELANYKLIDITK